MEGAPLDSAVVDMGVLLAYGSTMTQVQLFERTLALLVLALEAKSRTRRFKTRQHFQDYMGKLISRSFHVFQKASASELRNRLPDSLDSGLRRRIDTLIKWRDRLAHRYLVEQLNRGVIAGPRYKVEAFDELIDLGKHFQAATAEILEHTLRRLAELPKRDDVPEGFDEFMASLGRSLMLGEPFNVAPSGDAGA
jgi:hypothetical protein